jgi:uncharacterized lipoprotein YmbA
MIRLITLFLLTLCLLSCSTTPAEIKLYSLSIPAGTTDGIDNRKTIKTSNTPVLLIDSVKLADYLNNRNLVIQINRHQIYNASHHLWAEDLDKAIANALLHKLKPLENSFYLINNSSRLKDSAKYRLLLEFDAFHATDKSQVIASGKYWVTDNTQNFVLENSFSYTLNLEQDGYLHTVEKLNKSLDLLATDILIDIKKLSGNLHSRHDLLSTPVPVTINNGN